MRSILVFLTIVLVTMSCGQNDTKQKEAEPTEKEPAVKEKEPAAPVKGTASVDSLVETAGEYELSVENISKGSKAVPAFKGPAVYLHSKKVPGGSYVFIAKANEWGVISINGKVEKLMFVKGYEDAATYSNADYVLSYDLSYLNSPQVENPTAECIIKIKRKGYLPYQQKIWGEWGEN